MSIETKQVDLADSAGWEQAAADVAADWASKGAKLGDCGRMCGECAFRKNSQANLEPWNVDKAVTALMWEGEFHCHDHDETGKLIDGNKPCVGFLYARQYLNNRDGKK